jgi:hypothetical protein
MNPVAGGCVVESSMVFCQKNILENSISFHGTSIRDQSDIVTHSTNILNKVYPFQEALFHQRDFSPQLTF